MSAPTAPAVAGGGDVRSLNVRPEVAAFALLMERELRANDHKPGWKGDDADRLAKRVVDEAAELYDVACTYEVAGLSPIPEPWKSRVGSEAADVANMALMVADVCGCLDLAALSPPAGAGAAGLDEPEGLDAVRQALIAHGVEWFDYATHPTDEQAEVAGKATDAVLAAVRAMAAATLARQAADLERLRAAEVPASVRAMVVAYAHSACSAAAYPNTSIEHRWLRDRWLAALDALGLTEEQARAECRTAMRGIYTAPALAPDRGSEVRPEGGGEGGAA